MTGPDPAAKKPARSSKATQDAADTAAPAPEVTDPVAPDGSSVAVTQAVVEPAVSEAAAVAPPAPEVPAAAASTAAASAAAPAVAPAAPEPEPAPAPVAAAAATASTDPAPTGAPDAAGITRPRNAAEMSQAVDRAYAHLRDRLTVGELLAGVGALGILVIGWGLFGFLFGHYGTWPADLVMVGSAALLLALILQNVHLHDFGPSYRVIVTGLSLMLGLIAVLAFLRELRQLFDKGGSFDIGGLSWWAAAAVAVIGGLLVWREPA
jgi:hypothetical protein